ncbi:MAG: hypothetical protein QXE32_02560 [Sulfolobales archaeon]|jgi:predicted  nucleic acid-binding Zn-ribbon protein
MKRRHTCIVCGRVFPEGQGVILKIGENQLTFHSKSCAIKFIRYYLDLIDLQCAEKSLRKAVEDFEKIRENRTRKKFLEE